MRLQKLNIITIILISFFGNLYAQFDFNNFKNLKAEGEIPADFFENTYDKIQVDLDNKNVNLKSADQEVFLEGVHYAINDLLHSGMVVYGDEVSNYVSAIADKLLEKDQNLRSKLRFYTIKTNETNAFSTYQGIIFITTGLISQLSNEAQLAYVISHEIAHYTEEHVVQTFDLNSKTNNTDKIQKLSSFSKENEFEADKLGLQLYYNAGYNKNDLVSTFDVLLYSYLPFEEIEFPKNYFNSDCMTIPEGFFPNEKFSIKAEEDADDSKSSHPNIKKRKEATENEIKNLKDWGDQKFLLPEERFLNVRTLCRFESIRTDIVNAEFDDALYSIYILEQTYPNSIYLKRMKAKSWLGIAQFKSSGSLSKKLPKKKELEGEIARLQDFISNLNKAQTMTVAMRNVENIRKENPSDPFINGIWSKMIKTFGEYEKFELVKFSKKSYKSVYDEFLAKNSDTTKLKKEKVEEENLSKYDKIKKQNSTEKNANVFDTSSFYLYAISDLLELKLFQDKFEEFKQEHKQKNQEKEDYDNLSYKEKKKYYKKLEKQEKNIGLKSFIYLEPMVFSYNRSTLDRVKSEKLQIEYTKAIEEQSKAFNMNVSVLSTSSLINSGTEAYNQRSVLMSYFNEITDNDEIEIFPTDFDLLQDIREKSGSDKVLLSILEHEKSSKISPMTVFASAFIYPVLLWYIPSKIMKKNEIYYTTIIVNLENGKIENRLYTRSYETINKHSVSARVYNLFHQIK
jgi:predicted Zn-dependent protease